VKRRFVPDLSAKLQVNGYAPCCPFNAALRDTNYRVKPQMFSINGDLQGDVGRVAGAEAWRSRRAVTREIWQARRTSFVAILDLLWSTQRES
jgi:hypothetical protein